MNNKFVQDKGAVAASAAFSKNERVRFLLAPGRVIADGRVEPLSTTEIAAIVNTALQNFRKGLERERRFDRDECSPAVPPRERNGVAPLSAIIGVTLYADEFEKVILPLLQNRTLKHAHLDRAAG